MPILDRLIRNSHRLSEWPCELPSDTLGAQTTLFWGANSPVPSFEWWDRVLQRRRIAASASGVKAFEQHLEGVHGPGLLRAGGCHGAAIGGGAQGGTLLPPAGQRTWASMVRESLRAILHSIIHVRRTAVPRAGHTTGWSADPRQARSLPMLTRWIVRAVASTSRASGHIVVSGACLDIAAGIPVVFVNLAEYDLVSHVVGPRSVWAMDSIASIDGQIGTIMHAVATASRPYRVVILSDHGIAPSTPTPIAFAPDPRRWIANEWVRRCTVGTSPKVVTTASGTVLQIWVHRRRTRATLTELTDLAPGFVEAISRHPAIALTIVADHSDSNPHQAIVAIGRHGGVRLGCDRRGDRDVSNIGEPLRVVAQWGQSPFAALGSTEEVVPRIASFARRPDLGDVACVGAPHVARTPLREADDFWTFETQTGAHGGIGGEQARAFILAPSDVASDLVSQGGAPAIHKWLQRMAPPR